MANLKRQNIKQKKFILHRYNIQERLQEKIGGGSKDFVLVKGTCRR